MAWDSKNKDAAAAKKPPQSWDDHLDALRPVFFDSVRTHAYTNENGIADYVEFWEAIQVDPKQDKWRVMHYMFLNLDKPEGMFNSENLCKDGDVSFVRAIYELSKFELTTDWLNPRQTADLTQKKYPADKYPELKVHFFDVEHYRLAANIEGIAFDEKGLPYRKVEGKIISDANFQRAEVAKSILAIDQARDLPKVAAKIEGGILGDIFSTAASPSASLDRILTVGQQLACMDAFVAQAGAFYIAIQAALGKNDKFDKLTGLTAEEKKDLYKKSSVYAPETRLKDTVAGIFKDMHSQLDEAARLGIHTEPFKKFTAECELYTDLLEASQNMKKLKQGFNAVGGADITLIDKIRVSTEAAKKKFMELGGAVEQFDRLQAWVANPQKDSIPPWLPLFIDRYYDLRHKVMKKVQERQPTAAREVKTLPVQVKPPIVE